MNHETLATLGRRLAALRRDKHYSLRDLATKAEISKGNLSDIERGKRDPRLSTLTAIAAALEVPLRELLCVLEGK